MRPSLVKALSGYGSRETIPDSISAPLDEAKFTYMSLMIAVPEGVFFFNFFLLFDLTF